MSDKKEKREKHLYYLDELKDYKISSGYPDVRGWEVKDAENRVVGKVDNLLVNKASERVVYLDVEVDQSIIDANHDPYGESPDPQVREFLNKEGENHLIIPIGYVKLNEELKNVYCDRISHRTFSETKRIKKGEPLDRDYEVVVLKSYKRPTTVGSEDEHIKQRRADQYADNAVANSEETIIEDENYDREKRRNRTEDFYDREEFDGANFRLRE